MDIYRCVLPVAWHHRVSKRTRHKHSSPPTQTSPVNFAAVPAAIVFFDNAGKKLQRKRSFLSPKRFDTENRLTTNNARLTFAKHTE